MVQLLWVKERLPESWALAARWMDLGDWITYRCPHHPRINLKPQQKPNPRIPRTLDPLEPPFGNAIKLKP